MTYFAELDINNEVLRVIVASQKFINSGAVGNPENWVETVHESNVNTDTTDNANFVVNGNYAGIGHKYYKNINKFVVKKPFQSWIFDSIKNDWVPPSKKPIGNALWNESGMEWVIF